MQRAAIALRININAISIAEVQNVLNQDIFCPSLDPKSAITLGDGPDLHQETIHVCYTKGHVGLLYPKDSVILTYTRNDDELELKEIEDKQISKNTHSITWFQRD